MNITEKQLRQLIDPDMPQLAREIIAHEIMMAPVTVPTDNLPDDTPDVVRGKVMVLRDIFRWIQFQETPDSLTYDEYTKSSGAFDRLTQTIETMQGILVPHLNISKYNSRLSTAEVDEQILDVAMGRRH